MTVGASSRFSFSVFKGQIGNLLRSSGIGTFVGILPGVGGSAASILAYTAAKTTSRHPERFGKGEPAGIMASEAGNNGLTGGALVPLLSLGIPGDSTTALLIGAFALQGIQVGPLFIGNNGPTWDAMIVAMVIANIAMFLMMYFLHHQLWHHVRRLDASDLRAVRLAGHQIAARDRPLHHRLHSGTISRNLLRQKPRIVR